MRNYKSLGTNCENQQQPEGQQPPGMPSSDKKKMQDRARVANEEPNQYRRRRIRSLTVNVVSPNMHSL
jgi:hypothetical protein